MSANQNILWACEVTGQGVMVQACLACAQQRLEPSCPHTHTLLSALAASHDSEPALEALKAVGYPIIRVTALTGCAREAWYVLNEAPVALEKPARKWARLRGTIFHAGLERVAAGMPERRFFTFLPEVGAFVTGRVDGYDPATGRLEDYKTIDRKRRWDKNAGGYVLQKMHGPLDHHVEQLRLYVWLLARNGYAVSECRIVYLAMAEIETFDVAVPSAAALAQLEQEVITQAHGIVGAQPPPATPQEAWTCRFCRYAQCPSNVNPAIISPTSIAVTPP
jgi:hypothetical protein